MTHTTAKLLAALAMAGVAAGAQASVSASANLGTLSVQIIDINPLDGITPTLSFSDGWVSSYVHGSDHYDYQYNDLATGASTAFSAANGSVSSSANSNGLSSAGNIVTGTSDFHYSSQHAYKHMNFSLTGPAAVIFTAPYSLSATTPVSNYDPTWGYNNASSSVVMNGSASSGSASMSFYDSQSAWVSGYYDYPHTDSKQGYLRGGFVSTGDSTAGTVYFDASSYQQTAPVPEPSEYLMLLAGLGVVGYAAKRRQAR